MNQSQHNTSQPNALDKGYGHDTTEGHGTRKVTGRQTSGGQTGRKTSTGLSPVGKTQNFRFSNENSSGSASQNHTEHSQERMRQKRFEGRRKHQKFSPGYASDFVNEKYAPKIQIELSQKDDKIPSLGPKKEERKESDEEKFLKRKLSKETETKMFSQGFREGETFYVPAKKTDVLYYEYPRLVGKNYGLMNMIIFLIMFVMTYIVSADTVTFVTLTIFSQVMLLTVLEWSGSYIYYAKIWIRPDALEEEFERVCESGIDVLIDHYKLKDLTLTNFQLRLIKDLDGIYEDFERDLHLYRMFFQFYFRKRDPKNYKNFHLSERKCMLKLREISQRKITITFEEVEKLSEPDNLTELDYDQRSPFRRNVARDPYIQVAKVSEEDFGLFTHYINGRKYQSQSLIAYGVERTYNINVNLYSEMFTPKTLNPDISLTDLRVRLQQISSVSHHTEMDRFDHRRHEMTMNTVEVAYWKIVSLRITMRQRFPLNFQRDLQNV